MGSYNRYLFIGGAPKCGTTSLFRYLSDHPDACPSHRKETYFFAREFDINGVCQSDETLANFEAYFSHCSSDSILRLEGTPYTLYAKDAAQRISSLLSDVSILFILRDPVERFVSDYKFHHQRFYRGSFQDFFIWQKSMKGRTPNLIDQGCYIRFLTDFIKVFGRERVHILFFEDLVSNPARVLQKLCVLLGLDDSFYSTYNFRIHNPTINFRSSALNRFTMRLEPMIADIRKSLINKPKLYRNFEAAIDFGKSTYHLINNRKPKAQTILPPEVLRDLTEYYQPYVKTLSDVLGSALPWRPAEGSG